METEKESEYLKGLMGAVEDKLSITKKEIETVNFIFWLTCLCEKQIATTAMWVELSNWAKLGGMPKSDEFFEYVFEEISFMGKIKIMEKMTELYGSDVPQWKPFINFLKKLNDSRNKIAHFKFKELMWGNKKIYNGFPLWHIASIQFSHFLHNFYFPHKTNFLKHIFKKFITLWHTS